jgi:hypothetical protein
MTTTVKIIADRSSKLRRGEQRKQVQQYLKETLGEYPGQKWQGPGWQVRHRYVYGGFLDLYQWDEATKMNHIVVDIKDPISATVVALKWS